MYAITDGKIYLGKDDFNRPTIVSAMNKAAMFKTELAAGNYLKSVPDRMKGMKWSICDLESYSPCSESISQYPSGIFEKSGTTYLTPMEDEAFDICEFFTGVVKVMVHIDKYISNMISNEQRADMKILDVRHYMRDNEHKLNAIQMQRLGYYLQTLEKERYDYKSKRLIASMFANDINALKDKSSVSKMNDILTSKYRPKVLDDVDIEHIINKKKEESKIEIIA